MVELVEDCLETIFGYLTPLDWVQISRVCQLWRMVILRKWNKITEVTYGGFDYFNDDLPNFISTKDARNIVFYAAQYCTDLKWRHLRNEEEVPFALGPFSFKVKGFNIDQTLQLWAENATELTKIELVKQPKTEVLQLLFKRNKIKTLKIEESNNFWQHVPTDGIENLYVGFVKPDYDVRSFQGHFPNLKKLTLFTTDLPGRESYNIQIVLSRTLPYVRGISSLTVFIKRFFIGSIDLKDLVKLSQLEELSFILDFKYSPESEHGIHYPKFYINLDTVCPKLRVVLLDGFDVTDSTLHSLLSLPNLEKLDLTASQASCLSLKPLPVMKKLSELSIVFYDSLNMSELCNAVKKMPELLKLRVPYLTQKQSLMLARDVIIAATSQGKSVIEIGSYWFGPKVRIENKNDIENNIARILRLDISEKPEKMYHEILEFVQTNLKSYRAVLLKDK